MDNSRVKNVKNLNTKITCSGCHGKYDFKIFIRKNGKQRKTCNYCYESRKRKKQKKQEYDEEKKS
jgi:hypothetical protein